MRQIYVFINEQCTKRCEIVSDQYKTMLKCLTIKLVMDNDTPLNNTSYRRHLIGDTLLATPY